MGTAEASTSSPGASPRVLEQTKRLKEKQRLAARQAHFRSWGKALQTSIVNIHRRGPGGYSTSREAHEALAAAFSWNEELKRPVFRPEVARPSFCSGAVYAAILSALIQWDAAQQRRVITPEAWQALLPRHVKDGIGPWGCANANGPGFAVLVHRLGAGISFTDWKQARPSDVMKIWWNDKIGREERGHLVILVRDEGDSVRVWSSNSPTDGAANGYGFKSFPKSAIRRVLFTRITRPAAFNNAPSIEEDAWLMQLMQSNVTWEECARRCGLSK